jgi:hypothetical protein
MLVGEESWKEMQRRRVLWSAIEWGIGGVGCALLNQRSMRWPRAPSGSISARFVGVGAIATGVDTHLAPFDV